MYDFSQQPQQQAGYQDPHIPDGTFLIGTIHLREVPFSQDTCRYVAEDQQTGLAKWFFTFTVEAPAQYRGVKLQGSKYMDPNQQVARGLGEAPEMMKWALKGVDTIRRVMLCDNMVRRRQGPMSMEDYSDLEGKVCAVQTTVYHEKTCVKFFLDVNNAKDKAIIDGLVAQAKQAALDKAAHAFIDNPAPAPAPAPAAPQPQQMQPQQMQQQWMTGPADIPLTWDGRPAL